MPDVDDLIAENERLAHYLAVKYQTRGVEPADLHQAALLGLVEAAHEYDPEHFPGTSFGTYAAYHIKKRIFDEIRAAELVPMKHHVAYLAMRVDRLAAEMQEAGGEVDRGKIADTLHLAGAKRNAVGYILQRPKRTVGLDHDIPDRGADADPSEFWEEFMQVWDSLGGTERILLSGWLGLGDRPSRGCTALGAQVGLNRAKAEAILKNVIKMIGRRLSDVEDLPEPCLLQRRSPKPAADACTRDAC